MVLAKRLVARQEIAHGVILPLQRAGRRHAGEPAEPVFVEDLDLRLALRVELLGALELVALVAKGRAEAGLWLIRGGVRDQAGGAWRRAESLRADDKHRRSGVDIVGGGAAEARHERARVSSA